MLHLSYVWVFSVHYIHKYTRIHTLKKKTKISLKSSNSLMRKVKIAAEVDYAKLTSSVESQLIKQHLSGSQNL